VLVCFFFFKLGRKKCFVCGVVGGGGGGGGGEEAQFIGVRFQVKTCLLLLVN